MNFDLQRMIEQKRELRRSLAARPIVEKLRLLDELRARTLAIRGAEKLPPAVSEPPATYRTKPKS